jgi:DNA-directed RNA polymerase specialized sigma24 family protein
MDREQALRRLPEGHAKAIRLRAQGLDAEAIAQRLGIPVEGVEPLLRMAEAKLAALINGPSREFAPPSVNEGEEPRASH